MNATRRSFLQGALAAAAAVPLRPAAALAQAAKQTADAKAKSGGDRGPRLGEARSETYRIGVIFTAEKGPCTGLLATVPVPMDWPEQTVTIVSEDKTSH